MEEVIQLGPLLSSKLPLGAYLQLQHHKAQQSDTNDLTEQTISYKERNCVSSQ